MLHPPVHSIPSRWRGSCRARRRAAPSFRDRSTSWGTKCILLCYRIANLRIKAATESPETLACTASARVASIRSPNLHLIYRNENDPPPPRAFSSEKLAGASLRYVDPEDYDNSPPTINSIRIKKCRSTHTQVSSVANFQLETRKFTCAWGCGCGHACPSWRSASRRRPSWWRR